MALGNATHLMLDLAGCNKEKLADKEFIRNFMDTLPAKVGMTIMKVCDPHYLTAVDPLDDGWSAVTMLCESHASSHTFHNMGFMHLDIFSCKSFDIDLLIKIVLDELEASEYTSNVVYRGELFDRVRAESRKI